MQNQPGQQQSPEQILMTLRILWGALVASSLVLVFLSYIRFAGEIVESDVINIFYIVSLGIFITTHVLSRNFFKQALAPLPKPPTETQIFTAYFTGFVLSIALSESITILGFVSVQTTHDPKKILPFAAVGILNMIYFFPVKDRILQKAQALS